MNKWPESFKFIGDSSTRLVRDLIKNYNNKPEKIRLLEEFGLSINDHLNKAHIGYDELQYWIKRELGKLGKNT